MVSSLAPSHGVLVLGMHRSGTSVLTRICNLLGVALAENLIPPREDNEKGFFEHEEVVVLNEKIFEYFGLNSQDVVPFPASWWEHKGIMPLREALKTCLLATYQGMKLWGVKDPRIGKLLPLWLPLLQEIGITPTVIIAFRDPAEVAASLHKREGLSLERGILLWLQYNLAIEQGTRGMRRVFIHYPDMVAHTEQVIERLRQVIPLPSTDNHTAAIHAFIDPGLRHHKAEKLAVSLPAPIASLYAHMVEVSKGQPLDTTCFDTMQALAEMFTIPFQETIASLDPALHAWREMVDVQGKERAALKAQVEALEQKVASLQGRHWLKRCIGIS